MTRFPSARSLPAALFAALTLLGMGVIESRADETRQIETDVANANAITKKNEQFRSFLDAHCIDCHDEGNSEGERNFQSLTLPLRDINSVIQCDEIIDQLTLRTMPPEDSGQPTDQQRLAMIDLLRNSVADVRSTLQDFGGQTVIRRLSNREYENTLRSLFGRRVDTLGLTLEFPKENTSEHIDTIGASLVTSGFLLDQYFQAASRLVDTRLAEPLPEQQSWHFKDHFVQYEELTGSHKSVFNFDYLCLYEQPNTDTRQGGYGHIEDFLDGVPASGYYRIEVLVQALHRDTHYDPKIFRIDFSEPFQIGIVPGDVRRGHIHYPQSIEPVLAVDVVPDEQQEWRSFEVWLEKGQTPRFIFPNGPYESRASVIETNRKYKEEFENPQDGVGRATLLREGALPHIRIDEIKIEGPLREPNGRAEEIAIFGPGGFDSEKAIEQILNFAERAYRRPLNALDTERLQDFYVSRIGSGDDPRGAALSTIKLILCSPSFLYLAEITEEQEPTLNAFDLASRLSYALWAEPPDSALYEDARNGSLLEEGVLMKHTQRMLADDRAEAFYSGFLDSWLNLRSLGDLPPPRKFATAYYSENLPPLMKEETKRFVRHLIENNRPVTELLLADYTFINKPLAKHYGLPEKEQLRLADGFQKIGFNGNKQRGGLLSMASVLTVSANGVDTSPVTRGAWILENILGTPPPPPPDEVPALDGTVNDAKSIREKLAIHRSDATCNICHRKIDPLGFALEHFDPVGRWRQKYPKQKDSEDRLEIDSSGELITGESFSDYQTFRKQLASTQERALMSCLVRKLMEYSTGRHMNLFDEYDISQIVEDTLASKGGVRDLLLATYKSKIFRSR